MVVGLSDSLTTTQLRWFSLRKTQLGDRVMNEFTAVASYGTKDMCDKEFSLSNSPVMIFKEYNFLLYSLMIGGNHG